MKQGQIFLLILVIVACGKKSALPELGLSVSSPIEVAASESGEAFYVLNSNLSHQFDSGSLLVLNTSGEKLSSIAIPSFGRTLLRAGDSLFITFDGDKYQKLEPEVWVFNLSNPLNPEKVATWQVTGCSPLNLVARKGYPYFALMCSSGDVYLGDLNAAEKPLIKVRNYPGFHRRALYLDSKRELLFAFVTNIGRPTRRDQKMVDIHTQDLDGVLTSTSVEDDIPDSISQSKLRRRDVKEYSSPFQFAVFDLKQAAEEKTAKGEFQFKEFKDVQEEMRWLYFNLTNFDGTPDDRDEFGEIKDNSTAKFYRTNFWHAAHDPFDEDVFYISHRGDFATGFGEHANNLIKVSFIGDPRTKVVGEKRVTPLTKEYFSFSRVFGFKGDQADKENYLGSFVVTSFGGQKLAIINSFRDKINFTNNRFALYAANLDDAKWWSVVSSTANKEAFFNAAVGGDGKVLTSAYYSNTLALFQIKNDGQFQKIKIIK